MPTRTTFGSNGHAHDFSLEPVRKTLDLASSEWVEVVAGTGVGGLAGVARGGTTGATASSSFAYRMGGETFVTRGVRFDEINWSRPITIWCRFTVSAATSTGAARF